jgi:hypothetical protein
VTPGIASAHRNAVGRLCILACILASVVPRSFGYAHSEQTPRADSDPASSDLRAAIAAFEGYNQALVERDYSKLREQFLYVPFVIVDDASRVITSVDAVVAGLRMTRESFEAVGYTTTKIDQPRVSVLAKDRLLLNCRLRHLKKDGSLLAERANFYVMVRVAGMWKIGGIIPQDPSFLER